MSKRFGKDFGHDKSVVSKKPRLEITKSSEPTRRASSSKSRVNPESEDLWGDEDFGEEELEEIDMIASQACSQDVNSSFQCLDPQPGPSNIYKPNQSVQKSSSTSSSNHLMRFNEHIKMPSKASQILSSSNNLRTLSKEEPALDEFKKNLMMEKKLNSTFQAKSNLISESDEVTINEKQDKLEIEYRKLLNDFTLKEGESIFLRQQLQQTQAKASKDSMEKAKLMEQQAGEFREQINFLHKETERLKTQYELQGFQLSKYVERCKMFESGMMKLSSPTKNSLNVSRSRSITSKDSSICIQTDLIDSRIYYLKTNSLNYPFKKIPQSIFELSLPEKAIVDIQVINRSGKRNLPILQDEQSFRIFENPNIVKPIVTIVDDKNLCVEFIQPDIAKLMNESESGINSKSTVFIINKIVAVTRELLLNILTVLQAIKLAMNNDDIRDMNDIYFSNFYNVQIKYDQSLFDSHEWHDKERGIEARRTLTTLSYIAKHSTYLCEYIAGKSKLNLQDDAEYNKIIKQMTRYGEWRRQEKENNFEMLEIIQKFVKTVNSVRRAHQFTGLICSICDILSNVQKNIGFNNRGLIYVSNIFKEMVFSRPLLRCLISMTEMMVEFSECETFIHRLIKNVNRQALHVWKNTLNFTEDACVLKIYVNQFKGFKLDDISTIKMTFALMVFTDTGFRSNILPWPSEANNEYDCCIELLTLVVKMLYKCMTINLKEVEKKFIKEDQNIIINDCDNNYLNKSFWHELKRKQLSCMKIGIRFLSYLTKLDPEFLIRSIDIDTPFFLFIENVTSLCELKWHEIDQEALSLIKSTFIYDKPSTPDCALEEASILFNVKSASVEKPIPVITTTIKKRFEFQKTQNEHREMTEMFASLLQI